MRGCRQDDKSELNCEFVGLTAATDSNVLTKQQYNTTTLFEIYFTIFTIDRHTISKPYERYEVMT